MCYHESLLQSVAMASFLWAYRNLKTFIKKVDLFISPTNFVKEKYIEAGFPKEKIVVCPHFVERVEERANFDFRDYVVFMGRLSKEKGLFTLLKAMQDLPFLKLKILGKGPLEGSLRNFIEQYKLKNVELMGFKDGEERFKILREAMSVILPSECWETMSYTVLESFSCGVPVIASDQGGPKELIEDNYTGLFFKPANVEDLKQKIEILLKDRELLLKMRQNCLKITKERYSEGIGYRNLMQIYKRVLNKV